MMEFFTDLSAIDPSVKTVVFTVITGDEAGERAILSGDGSYRGYGDTEFLKSQVTGLRSLSGSGLIELHGREIFYEQLPGKQNMVICGAGHVSIPLIRLARMTGFEVTVIEDRPGFADHAAAAGADHVICDDFTHALKKIPGGSDTYFVVVTRGHRYDLDCLPLILQKDYAYIGMMASRRRTAVVRDNLTSQGFTQEQTARIHMPIGLKIGAQTPEELGISIMGEIIQIRRKEHSSFGYPEEITECISNYDRSAPDSGRGPILATIIRKRGSAPRAAGTKMLFLPDGRSIGTIGGGCAEAEAATEARRMYLREDVRCRLCHIDMTAEEAAEEGMVCGGTYDVLLEKI